jgi:glycosyltransferase involved in cell wall biosynthesis
MAEPLDRTGDAVILPVYNEAATVAAVLDEVRRIFDGDVFVIDDGSEDGTAEILAARGDVCVISHSENLGYGRSLTDGIIRATGRGARRVVTMDCDGQHEPRHIPVFLYAVDAFDADVVSGSRYLPESPVIGKAPPQRKELNARVTQAVNAVTGWGITDAFCGFKAYRVAAVRELDLREPGYAMPLELWAKAFRAGLSVLELPVERIYFDGDRSFGQDLDDAEKRFAYYERVWLRALEEGTNG